MAHYATVAATIVTGNSISTAINIAEHQHVTIDCPTWSVGCLTALVALQVQGCDTVDGTFRPVHHQGVSSAASGGVVWEMLDGAGNICVAFDVPSKPNFIKLYLADNSATANVLTRVTMYSD